MYQNNYMNKFFLKVKSSLITEKNIICVSNSGVGFKRVGIVFLIWNIMLAFWTSFATIKYFEMRGEILKKNEKIVKLESVKQKLLSEIVLFNEDITNVRNFLVSLNKYDRFETVGVNENSLEKIDNPIAGDMNNVKVVINRVEDNAKALNRELVSRISNLNNIKGSLNLDNNVQLVSYNTTDEKVDNVAETDELTDSDISDSIVLKKTLDSNISHLAELEKFINAMPFSEPMQSFYVSSEYGKRLDPFLKTTREHHGIDLVGPYLARVVAPADGKVVFVGIKGGYGKTVVLEHEYGMSTLYGHLNSFNVKVGDVLKRGDLIGLQGNSGRSTGQHLHYEIVKNKNERFNPEEFINVGSNFY